MYSDDLPTLHTTSMRLLLFTYEFLPFSGGIATYCYELACALCSLGHSVMVVALKSGDLNGPGFPFLLKWIEPGNPHTLRYRALNTLRSAAKEFLPDVLLATARSALTVASVFRLTTRTECIPILHGSEIIQQGDRSTLYRRFVSWNMSRFYRSARRVICISGYTRELLLDTFSLSPRNAVVVHNGMKNHYIKENHSGDAIRSAWRIPSTSIVLLTIARLTPRKGQDVIIRALPKIIDQHPSVVYLCAGTGDYGTVLRSLSSKLGVERNVIFAGRIPENEKYSYYAACELFVMPSRRDQDGVEGFGLSFLEAWHVSKPVLGSTHGGVVEVIDNGINGVTVDPYDVSGVADQILALLSTPERLKEMGERGHNKATTMLTDLIMAERIVQALK